MSETTTPLRYRGQSSQYVDIAIRGTEHLGLALEYAVHPSGVGCVIFRFVVHGEGLQKSNFTHLTYRETAQFLKVGADPSNAEMFKGVRLNKLAIPVFQPAVQKREFDYFAAKFGVWSLLTEWVAEQVTTEGFTLTGDLLDEIRSLLVAPPTPEDSVKCVIELPNLAAPEQKAAALKMVSPVEDDDSDEDDEDDEETIN